MPSLYGNQLTDTLANQQHPGKGDDLVVRVVPLHFNSAEQLLPVLRPMLPSTSNVSTYIPTNTLILSGPAAQVSHLVTLIAQLDNSNQKSVDIIPLKRAIAADVVKELTGLLKADNTPGSPMVSITADDRSNSVLVKGNLMQQQHIKALIKKLDQQYSDTSGNSQVIFLHYLKASYLVPILGGIAKASYGGDNVKVEKSQSSLPQTWEPLRRVIPMTVIMAVWAIHRVQPVTATITRKTPRS